MNIDVDKLHIETDEVLRYMGIKAAKSCPETLDGLKAEIKEIYTAITELVKPKYIYKGIRLENCAIEGSGPVLRGGSIERFLCGVEAAALIVVTLGHEYEQFVRSRTHMGSSRQNLIIDALGTEMVEKCADLVEREIRDSMGKSISSRFSPGYGDFSLQFQKPLLEYLEAHKIGVYCNEHFMMFPQKSVTAVVKFEAFKGGCEQCGKADCGYKK